MRNFLTKLLTFFLSITFVVLLCSTVFAQSAFVPQVSGTTKTLGSIFFLNDNIGFVGGAQGTLLKTTNGGTNWIALNSGQDGYCAGIYFLNESTGYIAAPGRIIKTTNGGMNWFDSYAIGSYPTSCYFMNAQTGYVVGRYNFIMKTTNAGVNWFGQFSPLPPSLDPYFTKVLFNEGRGFITVAGSSNLLITTNHGINWVDVTTRPSGSHGAWGMDFHGQLGYIVGYDNTDFLIRPIMFKTVNNGSNWTEQIFLDKEGDLTNVSIFKNNPNYICMCGFYNGDSLYRNRGLIMRSTDGGVNWTEEQVGTATQTVTLWGIASTNRGDYVVGTGGRILFADRTTGITQNSTEIPDGYSLGQNYPNPFNPETKIQFSIQKKEFVTLSIYNIEGKEITKLVNTMLEPGTYEYQFNASNYSSGIYFYKIETENFSDTKRMMLVK